MVTLSVNNEYAPLEQVIIGLGAPYLRDKTKIASEMAEFPFIPQTDRKAEVLALEYPTEDQLLDEFKDFVALLERHHIDVLFADASAAYSFDYTCPRDIGFVIGQWFFVSNMAVASRTEEFKTVAHHLQGIDPSNILSPPPDCLLEGGDVVQLDDSTVLVGYNQRSNRRGADYLQTLLGEVGYKVIPVKHSQLHLDCCLNPLGLGHMLIHPDSLEGNADATWRLLKQYQWIEVYAMEREHLATNVLSINPATIIARDHPACARVNTRLEQCGYAVEAITFDGVPATGGSFRCASLALRRSVR